MRLNDMIREKKREIREKRSIQAHFDQMISIMNDQESCAHCLALIIKQIHAIEKGLAMKSLRYGFGIPRISLMLDYIEKYISLGGDYDIDEIVMASSVLKSYIELHDEIGYTSKEYIEIKERTHIILDSYKFERQNNENIGGGAYSRFIQTPMVYSYMNLQNL